MPLFVFQRVHLRSTSGSFAVQSGDHFRPGDHSAVGDHLRRCTSVSDLLYGQDLVKRGEILYRVYTHF